MPDKVVPYGSTGHDASRYPSTDRQPQKCDSLAVLAAERLRDAQ